MVLRCGSASNRPGDGRYKVKRGDLFYSGWYGARETAQESQLPAQPARGGLTRRSIPGGHHDTCMILGLFITNGKSHIWSLCRVSWRSILINSNSRDFIAPTGIRVALSRAQNREVFISSSILIVNTPTLAVRYDAYTKTDGVNTCEL